MAHDTVTLELQGDVSLANFAEALEHMARLVSALADEVQAEGIRWEISDLAAGSATATARGVPKNGAGPADVERVVRSFLEVGQALETRTTIPFSELVRKEAAALAQLVRQDVSAIRFETADSDAIVTGAPSESATPPPASTQRPSAYGSVTGRIQTLTSRGSLRFTTYDRIYDRPVSCYLLEGSESVMRDVWGKVAIVDGWVSRDPKSGRPLSVRRVTSVHPIEHEGEPGGYREARGAIPRQPDEPRSEERIRRLRDAG